VDDFSVSLNLQIGPRIRSARKAKGLTQSEISRQTGLDQAYILRLENGSAEGSTAQFLAIALARTWQGLPVELRTAMKVAVDALGKQKDGQD